MQINIINRTQFLKTLNILNDHANKICITITSDEDFKNETIFKKFNDNFISVQAVKKWPGTIRTTKAYMYTYLYDKNLKEFFKSYSQFFRKYEEDGYILSSSLDDIEADISFFDGDKLLLYTICHEEIIEVTDNRLKEQLIEFKVK